MLYRFRSKAGADVIMTAPHGDRVLRAAGREPAPQGIFTLEQLAPAMAAIDAAIAQAEAQRAAAREAAAQAVARGEADAGQPPEGTDTLGLRQRAWPLRELMRHALAAEADVRWGA